MGVQVAFVDNNGDVITVMSPGSDNLYANGATYGEYVAWHIDVNEDAADFVATKYFDFDLNGFSTRQPRPSNFYNWNKNSRLWEFNSIKAMEWVRIERKMLLTACDWTQLADSPLTLEQKEAWQLYRQQLRDLPEQITIFESMEDVIWPVPPTT